VLTLIVLVVGCTKSKPPATPPQPNPAAAASRDAAQQDVNAAQAKVDDLGTALTKSELELEKLKAQAKPADADGGKQDALVQEIAAAEKQIKDQRAALEKATKELTERNLELQKAHKAADALHNDPDRK
jgi:chromosome segregation ATPase